MRRWGLVAGASVVVLLSASPAFAAWSASGNGSGAATAGSLSTPSLGATTGITASAATINWTAPGGSQNAATYTATATASGHTTKSCNAAASASSCALSGLDAATTYSVAVRAALATNWVSGSATTPVTTSAAVSTLHVSALTGSAARQNTNKYHATVTVSVKDNTGALVGGVAVSGSWNPAASGEPSSCTTAASGGGLGTCSFTTGASAFDNPNPETWTVSSLTKATYTYDSTADVLEAIRFDCTNATCTSSTS
jgi:hypothetical protein